MKTRIGLISDTHGLLRPEALRALQDVTHILHAGDIGDAAILRELERIAPVSAVRGNNDTRPWAADIPETRTVTLGSLDIFLLHDVKELGFDPWPAGIRVVVSGHSHRPSAELRSGVLFVNPGSAGPRRFKLPVSVALLEIVDGRPRAEIRRLDLGT